MYIYSVPSVSGNALPLKYCGPVATPLLSKMTQHKRIVTDSEQSKVPT